MEANHQETNIVEESKAPAPEDISEPDKQESKKGYVKVNLFNYIAKFPFEPYSIQKEYMARVIRA